MKNSHIVGYTTLWDITTASRPEDVTARIPFPVSPQEPQVSPTEGRTWGTWGTWGTHYKRAPLSK